MISTEMKKRLKKLLALTLVPAMMVGVLTACGSSGDASSGSAKAPTGAVNVVSREDGSGTRGAFIELFGVQVKDANGKKVDQTVSSAEITNSTAVMIQTVAGNKAAIGYISLGSLSDDVKALKVDGVYPSVDTVKSGEYKVSRPFNIVTGKKLSPAAEDFISFIMSNDGQQIVEKEGYVREDAKDAYAKSDAKGSISVAGSSSVTPLMEKLVEAYAKVNTDIKVEVQESDSTTGITSTAEGVCDIGMASRELDQSETDKGITAKEIARDGIAVIVNNDNGLDNIASDSVTQIYTGKITDWADVK